jgi:hypothetical protein
MVTAAIDLSPSRFRSTGTVGDRQRELAGSAANIDHHVLSVQPERFGQHVDRGGEVSMAVPVIKVGYLPAKTQAHASQMPPGGRAVIAGRSAYRLVLEYSPTAARTRS